MTTELVKTSIFAPADLDRPGKQKIVPPLPGLVRKVHISTMLETAFNVVAWELREIQLFIERGGTMDLQMAKKFEILSRQMVSLAGEERAQNAADSLQNLSDEELTKLVAESHPKLGA